MFNSPEIHTEENNNEQPSAIQDRIKQEYDNVVTLRSIVD